MADFRQDQYNKYYTKLEKYRKKLPSFVNEYICKFSKNLHTYSSLSDIFFAFVYPKYSRKKEFCKKCFPQGLRLFCAKK